MGVGVGESERVWGKRRIYKVKQCCKQVVPYVVRGVVPVMQKNKRCAQIDVDTQMI